MPSVDLEELDDANEQRRDFRRANGAPLVSDPEDSTRTLRYSRPSSYAKVLDDEEALHNWRIWKGMQGVAESKALQIAVAGCPDDDRDTKKELREKALDKGAANERADQGTGLHAMTARIETPTDTWEPPELYEPDLTAYTSCLHRYGLVSEMIEVNMVNDEWRAAGTADRIYRLTKDLTLPTGEVMVAGTLVLGDLKTGQKLDFSLPGYCVQMAIYALSSLYDIHTERRIPTPHIDERWTILVHLPVGHARCELLWCSIEVGNYGAYLAQQVKEWRKKWKSGRDFYDALPIPEPVDMVEVLKEEFEATDVTPPAELTADLVAWSIERIRAIGQNDKARQKLLLQWPADIPAPRRGDWEPAQIVRILDLLDRVEAEYSIPITGTDPRWVFQKGKHKGDMVRSNEFMIVN